MIRATGLSVRRGTQLLLEHAEFVIHPGERVGLVGRNGSGKSTLFALMRGEIDADAGDLQIPAVWRVASVAQTIVDFDRAAREYVIDGHQELRDLQRQRVEAQDAAGETIANLEVALEQAGAWQANSRAEALLAGLGFAPAEWDKPVGTFSGGWQMRIALARALMAPSELLLLDEPTNHLDLDAMIWLERWLAAYDGTAIIISHDSEFLDSVCNTIIHIEQRKLTRYKGNYESFLSQRAERLRQTKIAWERQTQEAARLQRFVDRFKAKASKAKQAQSRVKALARMQTMAPLHAEAAIDIRIPSPDDTPERLLTLKEAACGYCDAQGHLTTILSNITVRLEAGDRIGVLGVNGAGKSTLIKLIAGELTASSGERLPSKALKVGYFAQHQMQMLDHDASALLHMIRIAPTSNEQALRNYLAQFGFTGDRVNETIAPFSGGEKARLALALIVWDKPNLLILDEPSNHLDVETREALTAALAEYEGSLLLVSHDRHLLRTTVDQFWLVAHGAVKLFEGDLDDYRQQISSFKPNRDRTDSQPTEEGSSGVDRKQQRREQAQARQALILARRPLDKALCALESKLQVLSDRLSVLDTQLASESFYQETDSQTRQKVMTEHGKLTQDKEALEIECLEIMERIEALEKSHSN
ncbi:MAG: ATP-binding cassette domain-containing protein [Burkholderiaceae bacterium]|nr:ATP-binding cassette domain-containing protein [Burkholderiaceae bacterium]